MATRKPNARPPNRPSPERDPIAERAAQRIADVHAIERLAGAVDSLTRSVEQLATACVGLGPNSTVRELRDASHAAHSATLAIEGAMLIVIAEGATLETVAEVREAMANG